MPAKSGRPRVLIIEDESLVSMLIEDMLDELGLECSGFAGTIAEATKLAGETEFECAILDVNLSGQRTTQIASVLRGRNIPFALSTGYDHVGLEDEFAGFSELLAKPFDRLALQKAITKMLSGRLPPNKRSFERLIREANDEAGFD